MKDVESPPKPDPANAYPARARPVQSNRQGPSAKPTPPPSRMRRLGPVALVLVAAAALAGGGYYAWQKWSAQESSARSILTAVVTRGNLEDTVTAIGTLQPKEFVDVGTRVSGQLKKLRVDIGAVVTKGQLLAEIDPSVYQAPEGIRVAPALRLLATLV